MSKRVGTPRAWMTLAAATWLTFLGATAAAAQQQERELFRRTDRVRATSSHLGASARRCGATRRQSGISKGEEAART
jgi:hypothetical protein